MNNSLYPCLWFDGNAREAFDLYTGLFANSQIVADTPMVVTADLDGVRMMGLNGGPHFTPNSSISFMIIAETDAEATAYWDALIQDGTPMMPLDSYPWSKKYGWLKDQFGIDWQIYLGSIADTGQKIVPTLMFCEKQQGKAGQAIDYYQSLFPKFESQGVMLYTDGPAKGQIQHAQFTVNDFVMMAMDSGVPQNFTFNEGISFVLECADQVEIDYYWNGFTQNGGAESQCGWCKDPFGISWQIIPASLKKLMSDPVRGQRVMSQLMKMSKIDLGILENA